MNEQCTFGLDETSCEFPAPGHNGFAWLKRYDPKLYRSLKNHIAACFDDKDHGYLHPSGGKPRYNKKDVLNFWLNPDIPKSEKVISRDRTTMANYIKRIRPLSLKKVEDHCREEQVLYTTSNPRGPWACLLLDIDDKDETAKDSKEVFEYLRDAYFSGDHGSIFGQSSTFGKGFHGYVIVHRPELWTRRFRALCRLLQSTISSDLRSKGFKSVFEIKGIPGQLLPNGTYQTCGLLAKFPKLTSVSMIRDYLSRPYWTVGHLVDVLRKAKESDTMLSSAFSSTIDIHTSSITDPTPNTPIQSIPCSSASSSTIDIHTRHTLDPRIEPDAARRMWGCARILGKQYKTGYTAEQLLSEYERRGYATGVDNDGQRQVLAQHIADTWDQNKAGGIRYDPKTYIDLIHAHVTPEIKKTVRKQVRYSCTDEQLAVLLYTVEQSALTRNHRRHLQFTTPNNATLKMCETLGATVAGSGSVRIYRLKAMKMILVEAKLIEIVDPAWRTGVGKKYGLRVNHPKFEEYQEFKRLFENGTRGK